MVGTIPCQTLPTLPVALVLMILNGLRNQLQNHLSGHQWRQIIKQQQESGLSQKAFCQSRNIGRSIFNTRKHKLEKKKNDSFIDQLQPEASSDS